MTHIVGKIEFDCDIEALSEEIEKAGYVKVVRCKDCKYWTDKNGGFCDIWAYYISNEEFFCGLGERRENND